MLVEFLAADHGLMDSLLHQYRNEPNDVALREKLLEHQGFGTATVSECAYLLVQAGETAEVASTVERIYPTEFDPAEVIPEVLGPVEEGTRLTAHASPTAFRMREMGLAREDTAVVGGAGAHRAERGDQRSRASE